MPTPDPEEGNVVITTVFDNLGFAEGFETAWGFAAVIETAGGTVLFDTGGDHAILLANMRRMNIPTQAVDAIVISHVHSDHLGGLGGFLAQYNVVRVYIPSPFPHAVRRSIRAAGAEIRDVNAPSMIVSGIFTTGPLLGAGCMSSPSWSIRQRVSWSSPDAPIRELSGSSKQPKRNIRDGPSRL
jgi:metal-dependent hydrolase (beta-lactamase superfamily II)